MNKKTTTSNKTQKKLTQKTQDAIRESFVYGIENDGSREFPTLDFLIKKHKVAKSTLYRLAQKEGWKTQRETHQKSFELEIEKQRIQRRVEESINFDNSTINLAKAVYATISKMMVDNQKRLSQNLTGMPAHQLRSLTGAAATAQRMAKLALGESTENINASVKDDSAFREAMDILDEYARAKSRGDDITIQ